MAHRSPVSGYVLGLDIGDMRIGAALASVIARLPQPVDMIPAGEMAIPQIISYISEQDVVLVVIGLPRNSKGEETEQSSKIRHFAADLGNKTDVPLLFADESLSSVRAEKLARGNMFKNVSSDSLAACFILEEYFLTDNYAFEGVALHED